MNDSDTTQRAHRKAHIHGTATLNWKSVSLMEALGDQFQSLHGCMSLHDPKVLEEFGERVLEVVELPVLRAGPWMTLARFQSGLLNGRCTVQHFSIDTGDFTGPLQDCSYRVAKEPAWPFQMCSLAGIEALEVNREGFYLYGDFDSEGHFTIAAIEPRQISLSLLVGTPSCPDTDPKVLREVFRRRYPKSPWAGVVAQTRLHGRRLPVVGDRWLVIHHNLSNQPTYRRFFRYYRWWAVRQLSSTFMVNEFIRSGHLALGIAQVRSDPLCGGERVEVTYWQPNLYSVAPAPAGCWDGAAYAGRTDLGYGLLGRIQELFIPLGSDFDEGKAGGSYLEAVIDNLRDKIYDLLTGYGTGVLAPELMNNCGTATAYAFTKANRAWRPMLDGSAAKLADAFESAWIPGGMPALWEREHHLQLSPSFATSFRLLRRHLRSPYPNVLLEISAGSLRNVGLPYSVVVIDFYGKLTPGLRQVAPLFHAPH